ncbi:HAD family hydrolase [Streptomyces alkaliterrae]|uniref:HAD hydrolase-like protein n=1 Tax=Streptomyces alkaliterrae TaxID=2213162 RepID=A0A5P0YTH5_9ACTN|nr:HAD hydrolase-like protein [Streptomyces alkaliterrae]MBB1255188.1 HAD hydrolase-like protein [Streptomyces alkaliterrae]MBB1261492.1 HAD hydrolase-like protein [Streptomyces alkaliterrae]MQS03611.1 HAD hydrolase-like protein [Streptomyces alkaliterrae]
MRHLLDSAECVVLGFDGPVCRLFVRHPAQDVAARLRALLPDSGRQPPPGDVEPDHPLAVLRAALDGPSDEGLARRVGDLLAAEELAAAATAWPTPYADQLIRTLHATGRRLAIVSDHAPEAVERYLRGRGLETLFEGNVHGRDAAHPLPLPDPDVLRRALTSTGSPPEAALFVGDSARGLAAARAAGVTFLAYARDEQRGSRLAAAGAEHVVPSLLELVDALHAPRVG